MKWLILWILLIFVSISILAAVMREINTTPIARKTQISTETLGMIQKYIIIFLLIIFFVPIIMSFIISKI